MMHCVIWTAVINSQIKEAVLAILLDRARAFKLFRHKNQDCLSVEGKTTREQDTNRRLFVPVTLTLIR